MAFYEGSAMRMKIATKEVFHEADVTLNANSDFKEIASKDTDGVQNSPGRKTWDFSCNAYAINSDGTKADIKSITTAWQDQTLVDVEFTDGVQGNLTFSGKAYISDFSLKATTDETVTFDYNLKGDGALTIAENA
jgi:predicted secreted protein